jgi:hypothetical protein
VIALIKIVIAEIVIILIVEIVILIVIILIDIAIITVNFCHTSHTNLTIARYQSFFKHDPRQFPGSLVP